MTNSRPRSVWLWAPGRGAERSKEATERKKEGRNTGTEEGNLTGGTDLTQV
jgi:hypothetical protein